MKALFDLYHPSHAHLFKNSIKELESNGHEVLISARDKEVTISLLEAYDFDYVIPSAKRSGKIGLITETATRFGRLARVARAFNPDVVAGRINPVSVFVSRLAGARNVMFKDSDYTNAVSPLIHPFVDVMYIPANFDLDLGSMEHRVDAFQELAYLHPDWFEPDPELLSTHGIDPTEKYFVVRFVAMDAHHDGNHHGFSPAAKQKLVSSLDEQGKVYITSEEPLGSTFEPYRTPVPPHLIHHLLSFADLYVGDSQTMATEAALLGTPTVRSNSFAGDGDLSNFVELEDEYQLVSSFADESAAIEKTVELAADSTAGETWSQRRAKLLEDKEDVTADMVKLLLAEGGAT